MAVTKKKARGSDLPDGRIPRSLQNNLLPETLRSRRDSFSAGSMARATAREGVGRPATYAHFSAVAGLRLAGCLLRGLGRSGNPRQGLGKRAARGQLQMPPQYQTCQEGKVRCLSLIRNVSETSTGLFVSSSAVSRKGEGVVIRKLRAEGGRQTPPLQCRY